MGLLDFLKGKRKRKDAAAEEEPAFQDDLASYWCGPADGEEEAWPGYEPDLLADSEDSEVYLSFIGMQDPGWICRECGTRNSERYAVCTVCGLPGWEET